MKAIKNDLPSELESIEIIPFFDVHIGSPKCNYKLLKKWIDYVKENKNVYAIVGGDLINNSTKASVGDVYEEPLSPMMQIQTAVRLFEPIKDKILGVCSGNHENRSYKTDGIDLMHFFCAELDLLDKYDTVSCLLFIRFGNQRQGHKSHGGRKQYYSLYFSHGIGQGGRLIGSKMNGLERRGQIIDADVVVTGHVHAPATFKNVSYKINWQNSSITKFEQTFVSVPSFLEYENYAESVALRPSSNAMTIICLYGSDKIVQIKS